MKTVHHIVIRSQRGDYRTPNSNLIFLHPTQAVCSTQAWWRLIIIMICHLLPRRPQSCSPLVSCIPDWRAPWSCCSWRTGGPGWRYPAETWGSWRLPASGQSGGRFQSNTDCKDRATSSTSDQTLGGRSSLLINQLFKIQKTVLGLTCLTNYQI